MRHPKRATRPEKKISRRNGCRITRMMLPKNARMASTMVRGIKNGENKTTPPMTQPISSSVSASSS